MRTIPFLVTAILACLSSGCLLPALVRAAGADTRLRADVRRIGERLTVDHKVPGLAVALIQGGQIQWIEGIGFADKESKTPVTPDTVFNVGSISKSVAAWGFMRLVERGHVELDEPIEAHLSRWILPASTFDSKEVTLRRVLSHTAGLSLAGYPGSPTEQTSPPSSDHWRVTLLGQAM